MADAAPHPGQTIAGSTGRSEVTLACAADGPYALPLAVMLRSAGEQLPADSFLRACVLDDGLTTEDRDRIQRSLPPGCASSGVSRNPCRPCRSGGG